MKKQRIIVYGTLRKNEEFHHLLGGAEQVGTDQLSGYSMYSIDWYPCLVKGDGLVSAECYEIEGKLLEVIDRFEGYFGAGNPENEFERVILNHNRWGNCWIYVKEDELPENAIPIVSGDWSLRDR